MTKDRQSVIDFLNTATTGELMAVRSLSAKKIEILSSLRPFDDWTDLIVKINTNKLITTDMLNATQEYLDQRDNMNRIMRKCNKLVKNLEKAVARGDKVVKQPSTLDPNFKLTDYQLVGLNWLAIIHSERMNGILADEMGLGKVNVLFCFSLLLGILILFHFIESFIDNTSDCIFGLFERNKSSSWNTFNCCAIVNTR